MENTIKFEHKTFGKKLKTMLLPQKLRNLRKKHPKLRKLKNRQNLKRKRKNPLPPPLPQGLLQVIKKSPKLQKQLVLRCTDSIFPSHSLL